MGPVRGHPGGHAADTETAELEAKLARYPVARYPVQHATTAFHLATTHLHGGRVDEAEPLLLAAGGIFGRLGMRLEHAKSLTMYGVAMRDAERLDLAQEAFERAVEGFRELGQQAEEAAASYDLGLVLQERGSTRGALQSMVLAQKLFMDVGHLARAGMAAREQGVSLLTTGDVPSALLRLEEATALAERGGDLPGLGAAANALGLTHLAADDVAAAVQAFMLAIGAFPRSMRAPEHAMVKANLAVAHERAGNLSRARLAARQALAVSSAEPPVRDQAQQLLDRLVATSQGDLLAVLEEEPLERWQAIVREEVLRWCDARPPERLASLRGFVDGLLSRPGTSYDLAESLIAVLVELPPVPYAEMVATIDEVTGHLPSDDDDRLRAVMASAMARFALPQWQRLAGSLNAAAAAAGRPGGWR